MKFQNTINSTLVSVLVLILFYFLITALILVFTQNVISTTQDISPLSIIFILTGIILLILFLLGAIAFNLIRLIKDRAHKRPGSRLKTRLILLFSFIVFVSLVPLAILSINFINISISFWSRVSIVTVLEQGRDVAIKYYTDKVRNLKQFGDSPLLSTELRKVIKEPARTWKEIQNLNPELSFMQVFNDQGQEIIFQGEQEDGRVPTLSVQEGVSFLPKIETKEYSVIRRIITKNISGEKYHILLGIIFDRQYSAYAEEITASYRTFKQLDQYKQFFSIMVIIFYFFFTFPIFLLSILISIFLTGEIIRPIAHLEEATRRVAEGDFSFRILARNNDELSLLVNSFNKMVSELAASRKKLIHAEKIAAWQEIARRLAHEIKNPLTPIKLSAQRALKKYQQGHENFGQIIESSMSAIIKEVDNLTEMLRQFSDFAKLPALETERCNLLEIIKDVAAIYNSLSQQIEINYSRIAPNIFLQVDKKQIKQVFANLIQNAIQAMPEGGEIIISGDLVQKMQVNYYRIQVRDNGTGIDEEMKENIFEPYFTTKKDGTGLGLAIVESIIFEHNGNIWLESQKGIGTTFFIDLPVRI